MIISLTGFMGCGKSSVGRRLSALLSCSYTDLDSAVENTAGRSIPEIFASDGEAAFRKMESETLLTIIHGQSEKISTVSSTSSAAPASSSYMILSLGGGTVMTPKCADIVHDKTVCIYLRASVDTLVSHLENEAEGRPMLAGGNIRSRVTELMSLRASTYEKTAHIIIDTDGKSVDDICNDIIRSLA